MSRRGFLTRFELAIAVVLTLGVGALASAEVRLFVLRQRRAEVGMMLTALRQHLDGVDAPRAFGPTPRDPARLGAEAVGWSADALVGFTPPVPTVRGTYALQRGDPMRLVGWIDVDGDGRAATYTLPLDGELRRTSPPDVY